MILTLPHHPCFPDMPERLRHHVTLTPNYIGFWRGPSKDTHELPDPRAFVDATWDPKEREAVLRHLEGMPLVNPYRGDSWCRFCGTPNGYRERSDGLYTWPEGFAHYVAEHRVRPPQEFVEHAASFK